MMTVVATFMGLAICAIGTCAPDGVGTSTRRSASTLSRNSRP